MVISHNTEGILSLTAIGAPYQLPGIKPPPWMEHGLCGQTDPEAFFPDKGGSTREAKSVCARCPVAAECLDYALDKKERYGIWGGLSERERRKIIKAMKQAAEPTPPDQDQEYAS